MTDEDSNIVSFPGAQAVSKLPRGVERFVYVVASIFMSGVVVFLLIPFCVFALVLCAASLPVLALISPDVLKMLAAKSKTDD